MVRASLGLESWMEFFYVEIFFLSFFSMFCLEKYRWVLPSCSVNGSNKWTAAWVCRSRYTGRGSSKFNCTFLLYANCQGLHFVLCCFFTTSMFSLSPAADSSRHTASSKDHWSTYWCWCHQVTAMWKETGTSTISFPKKGSSDSLIWTKYRPLVLPRVNNNFWVSVLKVDFNDKLYLAPLTTVSMSSKCTVMYNTL